MNILSLIVEYNPLHNGHVYHIKKSKEVTKANYVIAIMSGNFVQRGIPSIIDKWSRTKMAILSGIDLVIELPVIYAVSTAEKFAYGAIKLLDSLNIVDYVSFGSENGSIEDLYNIAKFLVEEPEQYKLFLKEQLRLGITFAKAREIALNRFLGPKISKIIKDPNNILGVEYLKSLIRLKSNIKPITIKRYGPGYNSTETVNSFASANYLRKNIINKSFSVLNNFMPKYSTDILEYCISNGFGPVTLDNFSSIIIYLLRNNYNLNSVFDITEGLQNRIYMASRNCGNISELIKNIKSKRYTESRIRRILLHVLLGINSKLYTSYDGPNYIRVLGFNKKGLELMKMIKAKSTLPLITKVSNYKKILNDSLMFERDLFATDIYSLSFKKSSNAGLDFTREIIMLK
ncbi:nucleotidyltransferase [Thermoanaerobacterium sp. RBIITD]|uniref:nucleotidyltransferase n=1 Tax=Thermoanaerobacterium sp. RBIITD TaxID=1550240 RepID=UPI000BB6F925|nr:nucleotidyltransferase [Thermoanaerobacterium sp. RBIITD]SNX55574.1 Predicted nucleotidyltransferase [Thermoanaerobacterium sp. RBIITD]